MSERLVRMAEVIVLHCIARTGVWNYVLLIGYTFVRMVEHAIDHVYISPSSQAMVIVNRSSESEVALLRSSLSFCVPSLD